MIGILNAPLLAMAYFAIPDGAEYLNSPWVAAWTRIARPLLSPLLTFRSPEEIYTIYGWIMAPVFIGFLAGLVGLHSLQSLRGGWMEKVGFWISLISAVLLLLGVIGAYGIGALDLSFFAFLVPGILTAILGNFIFGIGTLKADVAPHIAAWLFILGSIPGMFILGTLIGHNSGRFLLLDIAWIITGFKLWSVADISVTTS
jgi:hypothetical protein